MKKIISLLFSILLANYDLFAQPMSKELWQLIPAYSDDFRDPALNTNKWRPLYQTYADCDVEKLYPENVKTGQLASDGSGDTVMQLITKTLPDSVACGNGKAKYSTGEIYLYNPSTNSAMALQYGYYEIRSKLSSSGRNVKGSFWLWNAKCPSDNPPDNRYNEIDIFEMNAGFPNKFSHSIHDAPHQCAYSCDYNFIDHEHYSTDFFGATTNIDFSAAFHTIGLDWQPDHIDFYIDGQIYSHANTLERDYRANQTLNPETTRPVSDISLPMMVTMNGGYSLRLEPPYSYLNDTTYQPLSSGDIFEVDYFHYYKRKPTITNAVYNSTSNTITLTVNTNNPGDTCNWVPGSYITINGARNLNVASISLSSAYNGTSVTVSAKGTNPSVTTSSTFTFQQSSGNFCNNLSQSNVYVSANINAPYSGCSSVVVTSGANVTFVASNSITLNPGFEVQLGGAFMGVTQ